MQGQNQLNQGIDGRDLRRDTRTGLFRVIDFLGTRDAASLLAAMGAMVWAVPHLSYLLVPAGLVVSWLGYVRRERAPLFLPMSSGLRDPMLRRDADRSFRDPKAQGILYMGNCKETGLQVWVTNDQMRTHTMHLATTGGGKTEAIKGRILNNLIHGSGFLMVDGKGEVTLPIAAFSMLRRLGRESDLRVINFMTGNRSIYGLGEQLTNTLNPLTYGSSSVIGELLKSFLASDGASQSNGDIWRRRCETFVDAICRPLVFLRDIEALQFTGSTLRDYVSLDGISRLMGACHEKAQLRGIKVPRSVSDSVRAYLLTLPGLRAAVVDLIVRGVPLDEAMARGAPSPDGKNKGVSNTVMDQHGYVIMQMTQMINILSEDYRHIFETPQSEIDMRDVIYNRRCVVVLLPALEKSEGSLGVLGKIILAALKSMMGFALGYQLEGDTYRTVKARPTNAREPFSVYLDEVGYYFASGTAITSAQGRSLGLEFVFCAQDLAAMRKLAEKEVDSVFGNTRMTQAGVIEDVKDTLKTIVERAGKQHVAELASYNRSQGSLISRVSESDSVTLHERDRLNINMLSNQRPGDFYLIYENRLIWVAGFYAAEPLPKRFRLSRLQYVQRPSLDEIALYTLTMPKRLADFKRRLGADMASRQPAKAEWMGFEEMLSKGATGPLVASCLGALAFSMLSADERAGRYVVGRAEEDGEGDLDDDFGMVTPAEADELDGLDAVEQDSQDPDPSEPVDASRVRSVSIVGTRQAAMRAGHIFDSGLIDRGELRQKLEALIAEGAPDNSPAQHAQAVESISDELAEATAHPMPPEPAGTAVSVIEMLRRLYDHMG